MDISDSKSRWIDQLTEEDHAFIKRFILASGSLKEMASAYGVSYPTVRLRLDRLIEKIKIVESAEITSPFERMLRTLAVEGNIDASTLKTLITTYQEERGKKDE